MNFSREERFSIHAQAEPARSSRTNMRTKRIQSITGTPAERDRVAVIPWSVGEGFTMEIIRTRKPETAGCAGGRSLRRLRVGCIVNYVGSNAFEEVQCRVTSPDNR
jgi:hypothetical protein